MSTFIEPMKALSADVPPPGEWRYEIKFDGFRALACKSGREVKLLSRTNKDFSVKFPELLEALQQLPLNRFILDGEIVALNNKGVSSFQLLQACELGQDRPPLCYYAFDLLQQGRTNVQALPLEERRGRLQDILENASPLIRYSPSLGFEVDPLLQKAAKLGLEGLIGKRQGSVYEPGRRSGAWIKLKLQRQQEFVIGGYTEPEGARSHLGALLLGVYEKDKLIYSGKVGTGFNEATLRQLHHELAERAQKSCPFTDLPERRTRRYGQGMTAAVMKRCHWVKPRMVCQVKFAEWTQDNRLRQPVYLGLREDKKPQQVVRETTL